MTLSHPISLSASSPPTTVATLLFSLSLSVLGLFQTLCWELLSLLGDSSPDLPMAASISASRTPAQYHLLKEPSVACLTLPSTHPQ